MTESGYKTSSKVVKRLIENDGLSSFKIVRIKLFGSGKEAIEYEYRFLTKVNAMCNENFLNASNGKLTFHTLGFKVKLTSDARKRISAAHKGKKWWHHGNKEIFTLLQPGPDWNRGRCKHMKNCLNNNNKKLAKKNIGSKDWNNGIKNVRAKDCPGNGWVRGLVLSDESRNSRAKNKGKHWWTNGKDNLLCETNPGISWYRGRMKS